MIEVRILRPMMKLFLITASLALCVPGPAWSRDSTSVDPPLPAGGQALNTLVMPETTAPHPPVRKLRESLRQPWAEQPSADGLPYRLSVDERRKMRELLRSQAHEGSTR